MEEDNEFVEKCPSMENYNRFMTEKNDYLYIEIFKPVANGYNKITNKPIRDGIDNFFYNLAFPLRFVNNILQLEIKDATEEIGIFVINSTIGIFGIFKPAQEYFNLENHNEDFGQTLATYGIGSGCHIVLPLFGPSNVRDIVGMSFNSQVDMIDNNFYNNYYIDNKDAIYTKMFKKLNESPEDIKEYEILKSDAIDLYPYLRDAYEQYREKQIKE